MRPQFKIATFNCNSLRARLPIVLDWLAKESPDVLALQETKATDQDFPKDAVEKAGWHVVFKGQKSYNGVAFVSKKPLEDVSLNLFSEGDQEARFISARAGDVRLINTYVPQGFLPDSPKFQKKLKFFADLERHFSESLKPSSPALWMGDLNVAPTEIDLWDPVRNAEHVCFHPLARRAFEKARGALWIDLFREKEKGPGHYTYWDYMIPTNLEKNRGWRIDFILGTDAMKGRLHKIWIDKGPRTQPRPSDHTFLAAEFYAG